VADEVDRTIAPTINQEPFWAGRFRPVLGNPGVALVVEARTEPVLEPVVEPELGPREDTQSGPVIVLWSKVTAACAKALPFKVAPVCIAMLVPDRMLPSRLLFEPIILPAETSLHQMLHGSPPVTEEPAAVVSVAADLKIQTPDPLSVRFPVIKNASAQYTPGPRGETVVKSLTPVPDQSVVQG